MLKRSLYLNRVNSGLAPTLFNRVTQNAALRVFICRTPNRSLALRESKSKRVNDSIAMKRSRRRITSPKKNQEENDETRIDTFSTIDTDVKVEILMRLSVKSIAKFILVSNLWSSLIRSREFIDTYLKRSLSRPRLLHSGGRSLFSCSQKSPSDDRQSLYLDRSYEFSPPVRGLVCCHSGTKVLVGNPTTAQFRTLPNMITSRIVILTFFGYDPVGDQYKVLCMTLTNFWLKRGSRDVSEQHQVFTLGAREPWRFIQCKHPHLPPYPTKGVCINGAVYYYAWINNDGSLISFDVRSELFDVIKLPEDVRLSDDFCNVVNYGGKIALASQLQNGTLDLRVLEDETRSAWSKVFVVVPCWGDLVGKYTFRFKGALSTGELVFAPLSAFPFYFISYDLKENNAKKVVINGIGYNYGHIEVFFDHLESPLLLS